MTFLSTFALSLGATLAVMAVIAAWIFRTASAPFVAKLIVPTVLVALACYTPWRVNGLLGYPVVTSMAGLPDRSQIVGIVPHDAQERVDLWLRAGDVPRAYDLPMPPKLKEMLRAAQDAMRHGKSVMLVKAGKGKGGGQGGEKGSGKGQGDQFGIGDDPHDFTLDFTDDLPPKAAE